METYPLEYVLHHTPLLLADGLTDAAADSAEAQLLASLNARNADGGGGGGGGKGFFHVRTAAAAAGGVARQPLSPRASASPLFPGGLMTPLWPARHRAAAPAVAVFFRRLPPAPGDALVLPPAKPAKTVLVLILDTLPKGNQLLEDRIQAIRRQCGLDSRNSLFIFNALSTEQETKEFVAGLQKHLYEDAVNYYREHGRRVKRKKSKLPPLTFRPPAPAAPSIPNLIDIDDDHNAVSSQPLHTHGWNVRYDFKMAVFAEFRQDLEAAAHHYEDAYQGLMDMFHSTLGVGSFVGGNGAELITPYSLRWTEAKILADCISIKICKLALYADNPLPALQQHYKHLNNFKCLPEFAGESSGSSASLTIPGLRNFAAVVPGNGSFEYWAWVSKQCRVFGELIEMATKIGLRVPFPPPGSAMTAPTVIGGSATVSTNSLLNSVTTAGGNAVSGGDSSNTFGPYSSTITTLVVQHAGYYYYHAAGCIEERAARFKAADLAAKKRALAMLPTDSSARAKTELQCLEAERTTDHTSLTIDLLTKSYEQFKRQKSGRMTLFLAAEIARVYESSGRHEMALKFFERISKTYRKENWPAVLGVILAKTVECARKVEGRVASVVEGLVELCSEHITSGKEERETVWQELVAVLQGPPGGGGGGHPHDRFSTVVEMDKINAFMGCGVQFKKPNGYVRDGVRFQVTLFPQGGEAGWPVPFALSKIRILFSNGRLDNLWIHDGAAPENAGATQAGGKVSFIDCSSTVREVDPDGKPGDTPTSTGKERRVSVHRGDLVLVPGVKKVFEGQVIPMESEDLKIIGVVVTIEKDAGTVNLQYKIGERPEDPSIRRKWFSVSDSTKPRFIGLDGHGELSTVRVIQRQPKLKLRLVDHVGPILLDETFPMILELSNEEDEDLEGVVDIDFKNSMSLESFDKTSQIAKEAVHLQPLHGGSTPLSSTSAASSSHHINLLSEHPFATRDGVSKSNNNVATTQNPDHALTKIPIGILKAHTKTQIQFHVRALKVAAERSLNVNVDFKMIHEQGEGDHEEEEEEEDGRHAIRDLVGESQYRFRKVESFKVACVKAFECTFLQQPRAIVAFNNGSGGGGGGGGEGDSWIHENGLLSALNPDVELVKHCGWTIVASVKVQAPCELAVKDVQFVGNGLLDGMKVDVKAVAAVSKLQVDGSDADAVISLKHGDMRNFVFHVSVEFDVLKTHGEVVAGALTVDWRRRFGREKRWVEFTDSFFFHLGHQDKLKNTVDHLLNSRLLISRILKFGHILSFLQKRGWAYQYLYRIEYKTPAWPCWISI
ncbi:Foie gras liver health family 1-domain-containing protein [Obelidium mucronatum]|nr:Foie gras liver health family 1-domain-containing protein [Obelidium mucronatum]